MWLLVALIMVGGFAVLARRGRQDSGIANPEAKGAAQGHNQRGMALSRSGDHSAAIREFRTAITLRPNDAEGYYNLGVALGNIGNHSEALSNFRTAVRLNPNDAEAHSNLGMMLVARGDHRAALREFSETLRLEPRHREARRFTEKLRQMV